MRQNFTDYSYTTLIDDEKNIIGLDVDPTDRILYYLDSQDQKIKRTFIPISNKALGFPQTLVEVKNSRQQITAIAIDWLAKNLYFVQGSTIRVAKADGRYPKTIIDRNVSLDVTSILTNPIIG